MEEADSLLELLIHRNDPESLNVVATPENTNETTNGQVAGVKKPKDDTTVIEELKIVNYQLR